MFKVWPVGIAAVLLSFTAWSVPGKEAPAALSKIVFASYATGNWELWSIDPTGSDLRQLTSTPDEEERSPAWAPDGSRVAFSTNLGQISIMNADGSNRVKVSGELPGCDHPAWHPDGKRVYFVSFETAEGEDSDIWEVNVDAGETTKPVRMTGLAGIETYPAWSPKGDRLAYSVMSKDAERRVHEEIWMRRGTDEPAVQVTAVVADSLQAAWSHDGKNLVFSSNLAGSYDIWVLGMAQGGVRRLTDHPAYDGDPCWSPDGSQVAFVSSRSGSYQLWVVGVDGAGLRQLIPGPGPCKDPDWSRR